MKFNPQPGDKIICNNGEEFICCTQAFLNEDGLAAYLSAENKIFAYRESDNKLYQKYDWMYWDDKGEANVEEWNIREVIPQDPEVPANKKEEPRYTVDDVFDAISEVTKYLDIEIPWDYIDNVKEYLSRKDDPQYMEYLRLKAIYE